MDDDVRREAIGRGEACAAAVSCTVGFLALGLGGWLWVGGVRTHADMAAAGQILVGLSFVLLLGAFAYGSSSRRWRFGGRR